MNSSEFILPASHDVERTILCSLLADRNTFDKYMPVIPNGFFDKKEHADIFEFMVECETNEVVLLSERFPQHADLLSELLEKGASYTGLDAYVGILRDRYNRRKILESANNAMMAAANDFNTNSVDIVNTLTAQIEGLTLNRKRIEPQRIGDVLPEVGRHIEAIKQGGTGYVFTGLSDVDAVLGPMCAGELVVLAGRPGMGKSSFVGNILRHNAIKSKIPVLLFTLEMDRILSTGRILFAEAEASYDAAMRGRQGAQEASRVSFHTERLQNEPVWIDDTPAITYREIASKAKRLRVRENIGLVVVDHLQLAGLMRGRSRTEEVGVFSASMKTLARSLGIPVIAVSQLSREVERRNPPRPILSDLRDSGTIEQDADKVVFLYREEKYKPKSTEKKGICEVIVAKNRSGPEGYREVAFDKRTMSFANKARVEAPEYDF